MNNFKFNILVLLCVLICYSCGSDKPNHFNEYISDYHMVNKCQGPWDEEVELSIFSQGDSILLMTPGLPLVYDTIELRDDVDSLYFYFSLYLYPCTTYFEGTINTKMDSIFFDCHEHQCGNGQGPSQDYYYQIKGIRKD